jgi:hypothetical protein
MGFRGQEALTDNLEYFLGWNFGRLYPADSSAPNVYRRNDFARARAKSERLGDP